MSVFRRDVFARRRRKVGATRIALVRGIRLLTAENRDLLAENALLREVLQAFSEAINRWKNDGNTGLLEMLAASIRAQWGQAVPKAAERAMRRLRLVPGGAR
jgi:tRNA(Ile)-lysidine synthase TilS/MesJ